MGCWGVDTGRALGMEPAVLSQVSVEREGGWKKQHTTVFYLLHVYYFVVFLYKFLRVCVCVCAVASMWRSEQRCEVGSDSFHLDVCGS